MSGSKHDKGESPFTDDLERNPGIGQSKAAFATGSRQDEADNTVEGDVENDPAPTGAVHEDQLGRTNS